MTCDCGAPALSFELRGYSGICAHCLATAIVLEMPSVSRMTREAEALRIEAGLVDAEDEPVVVRAARPARPGFRIPPRP